MYTRMKRGFSALLAIVLIMGAVNVGTPTNVYAATEFAEGTGTEGDPFQIETVQQLAAMNTGLDKHYILVLSETYQIRRKTVSIRRKQEIPDDKTNMTKLSPPL